MNGAWHVSSTAIRDYFGDGPSEPCPTEASATKRSLRPRLSVFAAIPRSSYEKAPAGERLTWNVIGAAFLLVCLFSTGAATITWALQMGKPLQHVLYVPIIWFPLIATFELVISVSIRPDKGKFVALLLALRLMVGGLVGFQVSEPVVAYLNHKSIAVQVAKDIHSDRTTQINRITADANKALAKLKNRRGAILRKENSQRATVRFWEFRVKPCVSGATDCFAGHAARLKQAKDVLATQLEIDKPELGSLNTRIANAEATLNADIAAAQRTNNNSDDLSLRERALGELMRKHGFIFLFVWSLRLIFWAVDISAVLLKMWFVRRGTVADKANEADAARAGVKQKHLHAVAVAENQLIDVLSEEFEAVARAVAKARGKQFVADMAGTTRKLKPVGKFEPDADPFEADAEASVPVGGAPSPSAAEEELRRQLAEERTLRQQAEQEAQSAVEMAKRMGSLENRYEIVRRLGYGGSSEVWLAYDLKRRRMPVAIKVLRGDRKIGETEMRWISEERATLAKLRHPHIVGFLTTHVFKDGRPAIVLEYVPGKSLDKAYAERAVRGEHFTVEEMLTVILPVCEALNYLHGMGLIHQDVKPANILGWGSGDLGDIRLTDFHIAAMIGRVPERPAGTDGYRSPEQIARGPLDERCDVYALGVIMYELVSGKRLFGADSDGEFTREQPPTPADVLAFTHSIPLSKVIAACLSLNTDERPPTALQLYDELRKAVGQAPTPINDAAERLTDPSDLTSPYDELDTRRPDPDETPRYEDEDDAEGGWGRP